MIYQRMVSGKLWIYNSVSPYHRSATAENFTEFRPAENTHLKLLTNLRPFMPTELALSEETYSIYKEMKDES